MLSERYVIPGAERMGTSDKVVYFIQALPCGPIKIGFSGTLSGVWRRLDSLQTGCPWPLRIRRVIPAQSFLTEKLLHEQFANHRLNGEWFLATPELAEMASATPMDESGALAQQLLDDARELGYREGRCDGQSDAHQDLRRELERFAARLSPDDDAADMVGTVRRTDLRPAA